MNHETTIKRIQELVPDVMALEFGCEVRDGVGLRNLYLGGDYQQMYCYAISINQDYRQDYKIIGKPITLAVVLLALTIKKEYPMTFAEAEKEDMGHDWEKIMYCFRDMLWNLSKDNFNDQSEETKTFIGVLLGN